MSHISDRTNGVLIGLAAGDRIGGPVRMTLCLANSLLARRTFDPVDILARYCAWWKAGGFDTGPVAEAVFSLLDMGLSPEEATRRVHESLDAMTAGCNPAHRVGPLAMAGFLADDALADHARHEARLTHFHPLAGATSATVVTVCRLLIRGVEWAEVLTHLPFDKEEPPSRGGFAPEVLRTALHFVNAHISFTDALHAALAFAGPSNYCPVLVGAIAGARWEASAVCKFAFPLHDP